MMVGLRWGGHWRSPATTKFDCRVVIVVEEMRYAYRQDPANRDGGVNTKLLHPKHPRWEVPRMAMPTFLEATHLGRQLRTENVNLRRL